MKVWNEPNRINDTSSEAASQEHLSSVKSLSSLTAGERFKAYVVDIKPGQVTIKLGSGESLTAKSLVLPEARIGDETIFLVKENLKGQIFLEMLKPEGNSFQSNIAREALTGAKLYTNADNMNLVKQLMDNKLPIDASSLQKALYFYYSKGDMGMEELLFLLKENFPATEQSIELLGHALDKTMHLSGDLSTFISHVSDLPEGLLADEIVDKFAGAFEKHDPDFAAEVKKAGNRKNLAQLISNKLFIDLQGKEGLGEIDKYYKTLHEAVSGVVKSMEDSGVKSDTLDRASRIKDNLEFMNHISNYKEYMQIPFQIGGERNQGELYIFKDAKGRKNYNEQASVLISLDYATLGKIEVFINKTKKSLSFQFKTGDDTAIHIIRQNIGTLDTILTDKGFVIAGCTYKKLDEPFQITNDMVQYDTTTAGGKRYAFDMRV